MTTNVQDVNTSDQTSTLNSNSCPLFSLPREIRDGIYALLLRAGDLAILRTSKQLSHEARERLYHEGICRMKFGFPSDGDGHYVLIHEWKKSQNFHFRLFFGPQSPDPFPLFWQIGLLAVFKQIKSRRDCYITIEHSTFDKWASMRYKRQSLRELYVEIRKLTTFTTVVVILAPKQSEGGEGSEPIEYLEQLDQETMSDGWKILKVELEAALGPAKLVGDANGEERRMIFHPQDFRNFLARRQTESES